MDDHELFRDGVRSRLSGEVEVVGEAGTVDEALRVIRATEPDVVLLDVHMPAGGGLAVVSALAAELPQVRFLALSVSDAPEDVIDLVQAGARGYVTKRWTAAGPQGDAARGRGRCGVLAEPGRLRAGRVHRGNRVQARGGGPGARRG